MKIQLEQLREMIVRELHEARKKPKKGDAEPLNTPVGYQTEEQFDFSKPMGAENLYKKQGSANFGPYTSEGALRLFIRECIRAGLVSEKHIGFKKLKNSLAHKKGVTNPAGLAASIGRKKLGSAEMAHHAKAGKKK